MRTLYSLFLLATGLWFGGPASADEIISIQSRPNVTQSMLLWQPHSEAPGTVILLIPGGSGNVNLGLRDGQAGAERPHLFSRNRDAIAGPQFAVVLLDAPSDQKDMDQPFRMSAKHFTDIAAVAREIRNRFPHARLVIMGHSRGTVSAGYAAQALGDQVAAVVLFSGI